ncbi:hypothetical protein MMC10_006358 [Thelotrema lepadinum]|nr:hypothetical protein [Thelotrema lepadinum]
MTFKGQGMTNTIQGTPPHDDAAAAATSVVAPPNHPNPPVAASAPVPPPGLLMLVRAAEAVQNAEDDAATTNASRAQLQATGFSNAALLAAPGMSCRRLTALLIRRAVGLQRAARAAIVLGQPPEIYRCNSQNMADDTSNLRRHVRDLHTGENFVPGVQPKNRVL